MGKTEHLAPYQFKPGQSGNPDGRPKGKVSLVGILNDKLANLAVPGMPEKSLAEALVEKTILDALNGDSQSRKLVWEYLEGRPGALSDFGMPADCPVIIDDSGDE